MVAVDNFRPKLVEFLKEEQVKLCVLRSIQLVARPYRKSNLNIDSRFQEQIC